MDNENIDEISRKNIEFSMDLYKYTAEEEDSDNLVISPFGVQLAAIQAYIGAVGETATEMIQGLRLNFEEVPNLLESIKDVLQNCENSDIIFIANKIFISDRYEVKMDFREILTNDLLSEVDNIDFIDLDSEESAAIINGWIAKKSDNKITEIIASEELDEVTSCILANGMHLKVEFKGNDCYPTDFWIKETESIETIFMVIRGSYKYQAIQEDDSVLGLTLETLLMPLKDCNLSMLILLPSFPLDFKCLEEKLPEIDIPKLVTEMEEQDVLVKLPQFKIECGLELKGTFKKMGMKKMFTAEAEFDNILEEDDPVFVQKIAHKVIIEVNESNAEDEEDNGESSGAHKMLLTSKYPVFAANIPFIYVILDDKMNVFFLGKFCRPKSDFDTEQEFH